MVSPSTIVHDVITTPDTAGSIVVGGEGRVETGGMLDTVSASVVVLCVVSRSASGVVVAATSPLASSMTTGNVNTAGAVVEAVVLAVVVISGGLLLLPQEIANNTLSPVMIIRRVMTPR